MTQSPDIEMLHDTVMVVRARTRQNRLTSRCFMTMSWLRRPSLPAPSPPHKNSPPTWELWKTTPTIPLLVVPQRGFSTEACLVVFQGGRQLSATFQAVDFPKFPSKPLTCFGPMGSPPSLLSWRWLFNQRCDLEVAMHVSPLL